MFCITHCKDNTELKGTKLSASLQPSHLSLKGKGLQSALQFSLSVIPERVASYFSSVQARLVTGAAISGANPSVQLCHSAPGLPPPHPDGAEQPTQVIWQLETVFQQTPMSFPGANRQRLLHGGPRGAALLTLSWPRVSAPKFIWSWPDAEQFDVQLQGKGEEDAPFPAHQPSNFLCIPFGSQKD